MALNNLVPNATVSIADNGDMPREWRYHTANIVARMRMHRPADFSKRIFFIIEYFEGTYRRSRLRGQKYAAACGGKVYGENTATGGEDDFRRNPPVADTTLPTLEAAQLNSPSKSETTVRRIVHFDFCNKSIIFVNDIIIYIAAYLIYYG